MRFTQFFSWVTNPRQALGFGLASGGVAEFSSLEVYLKIGLLLLSILLTLLSIFKLSWQLRDRWQKKRATNDEDDETDETPID